MCLSQWYFLLRPICPVCACYVISFNPLPSKIRPPNNSGLVLLVCSGAVVRNSLHSEIHFYEWINTLFFFPFHLWIMFQCVGSLLWLHPSSTLSQRDVSLIFWPPLKLEHIPRLSQTALFLPLPTEAPASHPSPTVQLRVRGHTPERPTLLFTHTAHVKQPAENSGLSNPRALSRELLKLPWCHRSADSSVTIETALNLEEHAGIHAETCGISTHCYVTWLYGAAT